MHISLERNSIRGILYLESVFTLSLVKVCPVHIYLTCWKLLLLTCFSSILWTDNGLRIFKIS